MAQVLGLTSDIVCFSTEMILASAVLGRTEHLKTIRAKAMDWWLDADKNALNLPLQSAVGILASLRPGVSMR